MDFFAAGGFQQLFNDLDDVQLQGGSGDLNMEMDEYSNLDSYDYCAQLPIDNNNTLIRLTCTDDPFVLATSTTDSTLLELHVDWCEATPDITYYTSDISNNNNNNSDIRHSYEYKVINEHELQLTLDHLLTARPTTPSELVCNNNNTLQELTSTDVVGSKFSEEKSSNISNTDSVDSTAMVELETAAYITREMAEWEEKFLDNYIEIPELIDFLPEKTPLCTETCEHFLHESSKNLKLHRKVRSTKRSNQLAAREERNPTGYACNFGTCDKVYAKPAHLKAHLRRHMGEKPYTCNWPECTWKFSRSDELARHRRSHSGVKPYKCNYCMKCFARSDHLTKHRKVHERRLLAATKAGKTFDGMLPHSVFTVRPGRKRKNQIC